MALAESKIRTAPEKQGFKARSWDRVRPPAPHLTASKLASCKSHNRMCQQNKNSALLGQNPGLTRPLLANQFKETCFTLITMRIA